MSVSAVVPNAPVRRGRPRATRRRQAVVPRSTHTDDSVRVRPRRPLSLGVTARGYPRHVLNSRGNIGLF